MSAPSAQTQLQVKVDQAVVKGQKVIFQLPGSGQQMEVTAEEPIAAGSAFLVQYEPLAPVAAPAPAPVPAFITPAMPTAPAMMMNGVIVRAATTPGQGPTGSPILPDVSATLEENDQRASNMAWGLYAAGWAALCCGCAICTPIFWVVACSQYYWKGRRARAQFPRQRVAARVSLGTCACMMVLALLSGLFIAFLHMKHHNHHDHHDHHGHHGHHLAFWPFHHDHHDHHHGHHHGPHHGHHHGNHDAMTNDATKGENDYYYYADDDYTAVGNEKARSKDGRVSSVAAWKQDVVAEVAQTAIKQNDKSSMII